MLQEHRFLAAVALWKSKMKRMSTLIQDIIMSVTSVLLEC